MQDGWLGCQLPPQLVHESTDNFQKMQTIKQYNYNLFFVDSKILHFTSPVAIVITTSELRPIIIEIINGNIKHTTMKTL